MNRRSPAAASNGSQSTVDIGRIGADVGETLRQQQSALLQSAGAVSELGWRFLSGRMTASADYFEALRKCESAPDVLALNNDFMSSAMTEMAEQTQRVMATMLNNGQASH